MKTDELIALLAAGGGAAEPDAVRRRFAAALGWGALGATLLMAIVLGVRPDLGEAARLPMFWIKLGFVACIAAGALLTAVRLSRPGARLEWGPRMPVASVLALWALAGLVLLHAEPSQRSGLVLGATWNSCLPNIAMLSIPVFAAALWAMKGLAPTRPVWSGFAAGLLSGAVAALVYSLHCPELEAPFLAVWYVLGMLLPAVAGALLGPRVLRW